MHVKRTLQRVLSRTASLRLQLLALIFLLGYMASFAHDVSVGHRLCEAHGEWVHDSAAVHEHGPDTTREDGTPQFRSSPLPARDLHEHCALVLVSRGARWLAASPPPAIAGPLLDRPSDDPSYVPPARAVRDLATPSRGPPAIA